MANPASLQLTLGDAAFVARFLQRHVSWDARACVRIQVRGKAVGIYGAPPIGCLSMIVVGLGSADADGLDITVSAGRFRDLIGDVSHAAPSNDAIEHVVRVPDAVGGPRELAVLPPDGPWDETGNATAETLIQLIDEATAEFRRRAPDSAINPDHAQSVADDIWGRRTWGDVMIRAVQAAKICGFLANPQAPVQAGESNGWQRVVTPAGRIFTNTSTGLSTFNLTVIQ